LHIAQASLVDWIFTTPEEERVEINYLGAAARHFPVLLTSTPPEQHRAGFSPTYSPKPNQGKA
jgi:hypothetical protein